MKCTVLHPVTGEGCHLVEGHALPHQLDPEAHRCHVRFCVVRCKPEALMCGPHWRLVPKPLAQAVWRTYREGQCDDKNPSKEWHAAADAALEWVAQLERHAKGR